jgi:transposase-like protein
MIRAVKQKKWQGVISDQETSGQSIAAFCRAREVSEPLFYYWRKRLREGGSSHFVELQVAKAQRKPKHSGSAPGSSIEVRLGNGRSLVVPPEFEVSHLRALLAVVESES